MSIATWVVAKTWREISFGAKALAATPMPMWKGVKGIL
jgi:hypothetical protein